jgi:hypothetical protein
MFGTQFENASLKVHRSTHSAIHLKLHCVIYWFKCMPQADTCLQNIMRCGKLGKYIQSSYWCGRIDPMMSGTCHWSRSHVTDHLAGSTNGLLHLLSWGRKQIDGLSGEHQLSEQFVFCLKLLNQFLLQDCRQMGIIEINVCPMLKAMLFISKSLEYNNPFVCSLLIY